MKIEKNVLLSQYTTFKIGGPAKYFACVKNTEDAQAALEYAEKNNLSCLLLGGGSNLLISDKGFDGLVIKLELDNIEFSDNHVRVGAGWQLSDLIKQCLDKGLTGLEFAAGIPGTVGGAIRGNAGTFGVDMSSVVKTVTYLDEKNVVQKINVDAARFSYRHSIFKEIKAIILEVEIVLVNGGVEDSRRIIAERLQYRLDSHPSEPSAGCMFKNVRFEDVDIQDLEKKGVEMSKFTKFRKIPTGYLIEQLGLKGHQIGGIKVSDKHANYLVNVGQGTAEQAIMLISMIKQEIRDKYGIQLQEEVQLII